MVVKYKVKKAKIAEKWTKSYGSRAGTDKRERTTIKY